MGMPDSAFGIVIAALAGAAIVTLLVFAVVLVLRMVVRRSPGGEGGDAAAKAELDDARRTAANIRTRAETEAADIRKQAEAAAEQVALSRRAIEEESRALKDDLRELRLDLERREHRLTEREERLHAEQSQLVDRGRQLDEQEIELAHQRDELLDIAEERRLILERVAGLTAEAAKAELVSDVENQAKREAAIIVRDIENDARLQGEERARRIITLAIQRLASEQTAESVVSVLHLPSDEMKGRIIGREGRNIRAFESVTGVNLIIDEDRKSTRLKSSHLGISSAVF